MSEDASQWKYSNPHATCQIQIPRRAMESFEDYLIRTAPLVRDALHISPAPPTDPMHWHRILQTVGIAAPTDNGAAQDAGKPRKHAPRRKS